MARELTVMDYLNSKRDPKFAYLWLVLFGWAGFHKLYMKQPLHCIVYLGITIYGWTLAFSNTHSDYAAAVVIGMGFILFIDLFIIPRRIRKVNEKVSVRWARDDKKKELRSNNA